MTTKTKTLMIRLSDEDHQRLQAIANAEHLPLASWARASLLTLAAIKKYE